MTEKRIELLFGNGANVGDPFSLLVKSAAANLLVDCGLGVDHDGGEGRQSVKPPVLAGLNGTKLDAALVTHGHLDHIGSLPDLANRKCGPVYMSEPAFNFGRMHWLDSMRIAIREWCKSRGETVRDFFLRTVGMSLEEFSWQAVSILAEEEGAELPFSNADIDSVEGKIKIVSATGKEFGAGQAKVRSVSAGHILGALGYAIELKGRKIFVSGDFSMADTNYGLFDSLDPAAVGPVDILVVNATYAGAPLSPLAAEKARFIADIKQAIAAGRSILVPIFAIDRATKIYTVLREAGLERYVRIAGQAQKGFRIYHQHTKGFWGADRNCFCGPKENEMVGVRLAAREPVIYLATSGMMMEKTISHGFAEILLPRDNALITTVGYMAPDTPGAKLVEAFQAGAKKIAWNGSVLPLQAEVKSYQFSAHARAREIAALIRAVSPKHVVFAHSEAERISKFLGEYPDLPGEKIIPENGKPIIL